MYIYSKRGFSATKGQLSYGYLMVILWVSYGKIPRISNNFINICIYQ